MIGDVPFYVGLDSADTWAHSELAYLYEYLNIDSQEEIPDALIRCAYASIADIAIIAIIQMQDALQR